jgi:hypothetical protein
VAPDTEYLVDFPTLWVVTDWIEAHCPVPDGFNRGSAMELADWQLWCTLNHYRVRPGTEWKPEAPILAPAFHNRRSLVVGPQKCGKGPWSATVVAAEGVGPVLFAGWAGDSDAYVCADHGCGCGWEYEYEPGEPMGMPWPTPLIQLTATSEDQITDNVYEPLKEMVKLGPLADLMRVTEGFIALPNSGRIDVVTASANARLGQRVTFVLQDESGLYTARNGLRRVAETQRRGAAGMGGRTMETTNCWDPSEEAVAQTTYEAQAEDVFKFYRKPPAHLSYANKADRRKIHAFVYAGSWWVQLDSIDAEAAELAEKDPAQAERFFGNRLVRGAGAWMPEGLWASLVVQRAIAA